MSESGGLDFQFKPNMYSGNKARQRFGKKREKEKKNIFKKQKLHLKQNIKIFKLH
jgi:hypothetical protein